MIEIVLAVCSVVGGAFLNVLFEEATDLLKMFLKNKQLKKHCLQIVQSAAENKQASNQHVKKRLKVEGQLRNLAETSDQQKNEVGEKKKKGGGGENKKDGGNLSVVLKSCNCEGCATKVVKAISSVGGVEKVMRDEDSKKLTVIGKVDPVMLREKVEWETHKKVELVSPIPKTDGKGKGGGGNGGDNGTGEEKKMQKQNKEKDSRENKGGEDKKTKEKEKNEGGEKKKKGGEENEKGGGNLTVVLKPDCHCEGCVNKVVKAIRSVRVVEKVMSDVDSKKLTVIGKVDLVMLREKVAQETCKNVELVSPIPKKDAKGKGGGDNGGDNVTGGEKKKMQKQNKEKDSRENTGGEDKKTKEKEKNEGGEKKKKGGEENEKGGRNLTVVLKPDCHCEGCVNKVVKAIRSVGVVEKVMSDVDSKKLTVIGKVDLVMLREKVAQETCKNVELVSPIPKKDAKGKGGGDNGGDNVTGEEKKKMQKQNKEKDSRENTGGEDKKTKEKEKKSTKKNEGGEKKKKEGGEENKDGGNLSVVLKSCQCEGCVSTVVKAIRSIGGVEKVMCDVDSKKLTVIGKVDPVMLREEVERKTQKNVEVVSPIPKKDGKGKGGGDNGSDNGVGEEKKKMQKQNKEKDSRENTGGEDKKNKEKEPLITTAVLKFHCRCKGCIQKIDEIVTKFKGYREMQVDKQKDLVIITGSMDMKVLAETLKKHLKKEIEIVPPKKEGEEKKDKGGGGNGGGGGKGQGAGVGGN